MEQIDKVSLYEVEFGTYFSIVIKSRKHPSVKEANEWCVKYWPMFGRITKVIPIEEKKAREIYDFSNENEWMIFPIS